MSERTPLRIQRQRTKGWRMPSGTIYVGRPTIYGNEYRAGERDHTGRLMTAQDAVSHFRADFPAGMREAAPRVLGGHDLCCWCALCPAHAAGKPLGVQCDDCAPCHADVLLEFANP